MIATRIPDTVERSILEAFAGIGYEQNLVEHDIDHSFVDQSPDNLQMAAFWKKPADQYTSAVAVRWLTDSRSSMGEVRTFGRRLWAPFGLIARPTHCELWDAFPPPPSNQPTVIEESISYSHLTNTLKSYQHLLGREQVQQRKIQSRQFALYEGTTSSDLFLQWAFQPTQLALVKLLKDLFERVGHDGWAGEMEAERLRWLLRFLAVRIAWDKGKLESADRTSPEAILEKALDYPTSYSFNSIVPMLELAREFVSAMPSVNLGIIDGGTLSQVLQTNGLTDGMRQQWRLYPTPADLAWQMVNAIPLQTLDENDLVVWDGTCGTGTLLVVALERLRQLIGEKAISSRELGATIFGNDQELLLTDLTRINLDIAAGDVEGQPWQIFVGDVAAYDSQSFPQRPNVILGNPPFGASGRSTDHSIDILNRYLSILRPGGLISTIMPRSLLGTTGKGARELREGLLNTLDIYEIWDVPQGFVRHTSSELAVICGRKVISRENANTPVTWKILDPQRKKVPMVDMMPSANAWKHTEQKSIEPPLLVQLREAMGKCLLLSEVLGGKWITEGITPGMAGRTEILDYYESGTVPYLTGRSGMVPFYLSWGDNPRWIRYDSSNIWRARRLYQSVLNARKVVLARWATGGNPWVSRAAICEAGLYPSEDFIVIASEPTISSEFMCGVLNSILLNCWLKLVNPSRTIRIESCRSIPMPKQFNAKHVQAITEMVKQITVLQRECIHGPNNLFHDLYEETKETTAELDKVVYDLYEIPQTLRQAIKNYYDWYEKPRPGFDIYAENATKKHLMAPDLLFTESQAMRLQELQDTMLYRILSSRERNELNQLIAKWQQAYIAHDRIALEAEHRL